MIQEFFNMSCGQTELSANCKRVIGKGVIPIYYPPFWNMQEETLELVQRFLMTDNEIVIVFGTGTSGVEACLNSILEEGDRFLVPRNGMFGEIMRVMVEVVGAEPVLVDFPIGQPVDPTVIEEVLDRERGIKGIGLVHSETSTGVANPVGEIGKLARDRDLLYVVDAVSSFGSEDLRVDDWGIDLCITNGQKCFGAPQGDTLVSVSQRAWDAINYRKSRIPGFYMNLRACKGYLDMARTEAENWAAGANKYAFELEDAPHPASPSYVVIQGLWASLKQVEEEGLDHFMDRHRLAGKAVRAAVRAMGLQTMCTDDRHADNAVTAVLLPGDIQDYGFRRHMFETYGVVLGDGNMMSWDVYANQVGRNYVRIGTMGESARYQKILYAIFSFGMALEDLGADVNSHAAVNEVKRVFTEDGGSF
jgi:aspartate aminotransferase-like enzyme